MLHEDPLKSLPVPTPEQTARFAAHVADNHSWYKHLPFFPPGASFVVFPNPHAGRGIKQDGDRYAIHDIDQGDYFAHHSRLSTATYVARFGHWDYWVVENPRAFEPDPGPWTYAADGSHRAPLADDLKRRWSCRLTAFVRPSPAMFHLRAKELQREADAFLSASRRSAGRALLEAVSGRRNADPVTRRYRSAAPALRRITGIAIDASVLAFMESEARAQRALLLETLHRVRADWTRGQPGYAESGGAS